MPQDLDALGGEELELGGKGDGFPVTDDDVLYWNWLGPRRLRRPAHPRPRGGRRGRRRRRGEPRRAPTTSTRVKLDASGGVDDEATAKLRERRLLERLREAGAERDALAAGARGARRMPRRSATPT